MHARLIGGEVGGCWTRVTIRLGCCLFAAIGVLVPGLALADGNGFSFTDAVNGKVAYTDTAHRPAMPCGELVAADIPHARILSARSIAGDDQQAAHCLVYASIAPEIELVVHLPGEWNGRLYVHGNGGDGGESVHGDYGKAIRHTAVRYGFVATFSNMGHDRSAHEGSRWAYDSPQRETDYRYRALHLNTLVAKQLIETYYGRRTNYSYFDGCSTGGGQGLRAAQDFPGDFDGILAGAPVSDPVTLLLYVWNNQVAQEIMHLTPDRLNQLGNWLMEKYDTVDGVADGVISNPAEIDFNPQRDLPRDGIESFSTAEIEGLARVYGGLVHAGKQITPGVPIGAELPGLKYRQGSLQPGRPSSAWYGRILPDEDGSTGMRFVLQEWLRYVLFEVDDPARQWDKLDLDIALPELEQRAKALSATKADLSRFRDSGGKLILYNGWGDVGVNPFLVLDYYNKLQAEMGEDTDAFARLFLVPGMFHCLGGLNVDRFDALTPLIDWVEGGYAPDVIPAYRMQNQRVSRTRPLCAYPKVARYLGEGSIDEATNFVCR